MDISIPSLHSGNVLAVSNPKLNAITTIGIRITKAGRLTDWADRPCLETRPTSVDEARRKVHYEFTRKDENILRRWCTAAEIQGILKGSRVFEQLSCLHPRHPWSAYEGKWRRGGLSKQPRTVDLNSSSPHRPLNDTSAADANDESGKSDDGDLTQDPDVENTFRVDVFKNVLEHLQIADEDDLFKYLRQHHVIRAVMELYDEVLRPEKIRQRPRRDRAQHCRNVEHATQVLVTRTTRFLSIEPDKRAWTRADHEVRFITRIFHHDPCNDAARHNIEQGCSELVLDRVREHCQRMSWLSQWLISLYRPSQGQSAESRRLQVHRAAWLERLQELFVVETNHLDRIDWSTSSSEHVDFSMWTTGMDHEDLACVSLLEPAYPAVVDQSLTQPLEVMQNLSNIEQGTEENDLCYPIIDVPTDMGGEEEVEQDEQEQDKGELSNIEQDTTENVVFYPVVNVGTNMSRGRGRGREEEDKDEDEQEKQEQGEGEEEDEEEEEGVERGKAEKILHPDDHSIVMRPPDIGVGIDNTTTNDHPVREFLTNQTLEMMREILPREYDVPRSTNKLQLKGLILLSEDGYHTYRNRRDYLLGNWGVTSKHVGTCILVPSIWSSADPIQLINTYNLDDGPVDESLWNRLNVNLGELNIPWGRAAAWFGSWITSPRRGIDLDVFLSGPDGPYPEMHGSHRCHHATCIVESHLAWEPKLINLSRVACKAAAASLRRLGVPIPVHCREHQPPCLMQHAALTATEAICIQFSVLESARGMMSRKYPDRPAHHPRSFRTFENRVPLTMKADGVTIDPTVLVSEAPVEPTFPKFSVRCPFCPNLHRNWSQITAYWSHLKHQHQEIPEDDRLSAIQRSAISYEEWIKLKDYNYQQTNPTTWKWLQQAISDNFEWDVVRGWRLPEERRAQTRAKRLTEISKSVI